VLVVVKNLYERRMSAYEFYGQCKSVGRIHLIVEVQVSMHGAGLQHMRLPRNTDCNCLFLHQWIHRLHRKSSAQGGSNGGSAHAVLIGGIQPMTLSARLQAAA